MTAKRTTRRSALPILLIVTLSLLPVHAALADDESSLAAVGAGDEVALVAQAPASAEAVFRAAQDGGCAGVVQIDTSGIVRGKQPFTGWAVDANETGLTAGVDLIDVYRGDVRVASEGIGVARPDVDIYWGRTDMRAGYAIEIDWSQQPRGQQTYTVRARTNCDWVEASVTLDVDPAPPVALSISDERRTVSTSSSYYGGSGIGNTCVSRDQYGNCISYSGSGTGNTCVSRDQYGNCISYSSSGIGNTCVSRDQYGNCISYSSSGIGNTCVSRDQYGNCISYSGSGIGNTCISRDQYGNCISSGGSGIGSTCISRDQYGNCLSYGSGSGNYGGSSGSETSFNFTVTLSPASTQTVSVSYATADGSAVAGSDYVSANGTLSFGAGETSKSLTVRVYGRDYGDNRTFYVRLSNPVNASIADGEGVGTIERRSGSSYSSSYGSGNTCVSRDQYGNCISYGSSGSLYGGTTCVSRDIYGNCNSSSYGYGTTCSARDIYGNCVYSGTGTGTTSGYQVTVYASGSVTLTWQQIAGASSYQVWYGTSGACSSFTTIGGPLPSTTTTQTVGLTGTYCLEVRDQAGQRAYITSTSGGAAGSTGGAFTIGPAAQNCSEGGNCAFTVTQSGGSGSTNVTWNAFGANGGAATCIGSFDYAPNSGTVAVSANSSMTFTFGICTDADTGPETFTVAIAPSSGTLGTPGTATVTIPYP